MNITEQIIFLVELQKLDAQIYALERRKREAPIKIKNLEDDFAKRSEVLKEHQNQLKFLQVKQNDKENELGSKEETIKKCQTQLYQIKTNKEYTAMQQEIKGYEADKSALEDNIIAIMDDAEAKKKEIDGEKSVLKKDENKLSEDKAKVNVELKEVEAKLSELNKSRTEAAAKVDQVMLRKYERILNGKDGLAMVPVVEDACGGCHMNLPPQVINEIKKMTELIFCESCARVLYIQE